LLTCRSESFALLLSEDVNIRIDNHIISPVVLYGSEIRYLTLREEITVLKRTFGLKREEMSGGWRKLRSEIS
jgi:hypothetical protein